MEGFTLRDMIINGWPVLSVLVVMSILSCTIILDRYFAFLKAKTDADAFVASIMTILNEQGVSEAVAQCQRYRIKPVAQVVARILQQAGDRDAKERAAQHALQIRIRELEWSLPVLGTIASTAPFVGLLGTVIGIIKAFQHIAINQGGGPEVVSAGIAEALITTAFGLFVAIPAVIGYNHFIHRLKNVAEEIDLAVFQVVEKLSPKG
jgi:biopolymer transport protein ExbB/biopolymer transport protein TolQ